jgi:hypothetical protein
MPACGTSNLKRHFLYSSYAFKAKWSYCVPNLPYYHHLPFSLCFQ